MARTYIISEICGDWALQIREPGHPHQFLYFNSENNADLVKSILEWEDEHPNEAVPYKPTLIQQNGPLIQADLDAMDYDKVWLDYGGDGEWALVVSGRIYALAVLEGTGFEDILRDEVDGETMDRPSGNYTVYRRPPEGEV